MWVQFFPEIQNPIWMPAHVAHKVESLTYVEDVARAVLAVVERGEAVWNQAYNLAMEEEFSLANILLRMRDQLGVPEVRVHFILMIENILYYIYTYIIISASKSSIRRFVITEKAPTSNYVGPFPC